MKDDRFDIGLLPAAAVAFSRDFSCTPNGEEKAIEINTVSPGRKS